MENAKQVHVTSFQVWLNRQLENAETYSELWEALKAADRALDEVYALVGEED